MTAVRAVPIYTDDQSAPPVNSFAEVCPYVHPAQPRTGGAIIFQAYGGQMWYPLVIDITGTAAPIGIEQDNLLEFQLDIDSMETEAPWQPGGRGVALAHRGEWPPLEWEY